MNFRDHLRSAFTRVMLASLGLLIFAQQVLAQDEDAGPKAKSYGLPYFLVVLMLLLGFMLVLRPSMRQKEFRPPAE
jgi:hypothetical protein